MSIGDPRLSLIRYPARRTANEATDCDLLSGALANPTGAVSQAYELVDSTDTRAGLNDQPIDRNQTTICGSCEFQLSKRVFLRAMCCTHRLLVNVWRRLLQQY